MRLLYFAWVRQRLGLSEERLSLPDRATTVGAVASLLAARGGAYALFDEPQNLRAALNHTHVKFDTPVGDGDELAFFPPVTGG